MKTYTFNSVIVDNIATFIKYSSLLDFITGKNPYWRNRLKEVVLNESSLSAVLTDNKLTKGWLLHPTHQRIKKLFPEEVFEQYKNYNITSNLISKGTYTTEKFSTVDFWKSLHSSIMGSSDLSSIRQTQRSLTKEIVLNNIHQKIEIKVKTNPLSIEKDIENLYILENSKKINIPAIIAAFFHLNIALIHPFEDGNGRIARLSDRILLKKYGISSELLLLEPFFLLNHHQYYELIAKIAESKDCTEWLEFYTSALVFAVLSSMEILRMLTGGSIDIMSNTIIETTARENDVIELLNEYDQLSASEISRLLNISRQSAGQIVHALENKKLMSRIGSNTSVRFKLNLIPSQEFLILK